MKHFGIFLIICSCAIFSCANKENNIIGQKLTECYKEKFYNDEFKPTDPFPYYDRFEKYLIKESYLKGSSKEDYLALWENLRDSTQVFRLKEFSEPENVLVYFNPVNVVRSKYCYFHLVEQQNIRDKEINQMYEIIEKIDEIGDLGNIELNKRLVKTINEDRSYPISRVISVGLTATF